MARFYVRAKERPYLNEVVKKIKDIAQGAEDINTFSAGASGFLASKKFDVLLKGKSSHAANSPEKGINALLTANSIITGFYNIPKQSQGITMINVGVLKSGSFRSIIPENAELQAEVRGESNELSDFMYEKAINIVHDVCNRYDDE